jgi:site-specific DNA-methyltransferase (cytosine-N4-specific)
VKPYYTDSTVTLYHGANLDVLPHLADGSVDCVVTSPPYFALRDYGVAGQYGAEETPAEFVANLVATFREVRRVLADDGCVWINLGDSYASGGTTRSLGRNDAGRDLGGGGNRLGSGNPGRQGTRAVSGEPSAKNLLGIPWRVAFALQDDGWILRNAVCWNKPNAMPESVTDRLSTRYEMLFLLSKKRSYWFDLDPIREAHMFPNQTRTFGAKAKSSGKSTGHDDGYYSEQRDGHPLGKNPGDVWNIPTVPYASAHFATYPPELVRRCIVAGCKPGGTVLDPFHGSGTTGMVAVRNGRKYVGIELNQEYLDLSLRTRLANGVLDFEGEAS